MVREAHRMLWGRQPGMTRSSRQAGWHLDGAKLHAGGDERGDHVGVGDALGVELRHGRGRALLQQLLPLRCRAACCLLLLLLR